MPKYMAKNLPDIPENERFLPDVLNVRQRMACCKYFSHFTVHFSNDSQHFNFIQFYLNFLDSSITDTPLGIRYHICYVLSHTGDFSSIDKAPVCLTQQKCKI